MGGRRVGKRSIDKIHADKRDVLNKYVKNNLSKLTSPLTTKEVEKLIRKRFYEENKLPTSSRFTRTDVAREIAIHILNSRSLSSEEYLDEVSNIPLIMNELSQDKLRTLYQEHNLKSSLFFKPEDLSKLNQEEYRKKIEEEFKEKAKQRAVEEINAEKEEVQQLREDLKRREGELKKFESELNKLPKNLDVETLEKQVESTSAENTIDFGSKWWKRLGMVANPLENYDGLYGIAKDKFDDVVVKTSLVNLYLGDIRDNPESFSGKTMMVIGDFGTGKTTLFEYLSAQAVSMDVVPILIILNPGPSVASLMNIFLQELRNQLMETYKSIHNVDLRSQGVSSNLSRDCQEIFDNLGSDVGHGFLVFIDGLHKTKAYLPQVLEFLQQIQNTSTYFTRNKVKVGFFIAGSPYWKRELENNPSMSGSYYEIDEIPILTEEYAVESIKRRINLYQPEGSQALTIDESSLRKSFQVLNGRLSNPVTFRDFISHVRKRLELNKFDEVGLSVKIHIETVDAVRIGISRSHIYSRYKSLMLEILESRKVRKALQKVIIYMLKNRGISESDPMFENNKGAFYLLKKHDFIIQHKASGNENFRWHLSDDLISTTIEISQNLQIEPSNILRAMLVEEALTKDEETNSIYSSSLNTIGGLISSWKESIPEVAELLVNCRKGIESISLRVSRNEYTKTSDLKYTLMQVVKSINVIMRTKSLAESDDLDIFLNSWVAPDNMDEIRDFCEENVKISNETRKVYGTLHNHNRLVTQLLDILLDQAKGEAISRLSGRKLTFNQYTGINQLRVKFQIQAYEEVVDGACTLLEKSIREIIYPAMRLFWGKDALNKIPEDLKAEVEESENRGHPRTKRPSDPNFLYVINRSEYSKLIFKREIFNSVFGGGLSKDDKGKLKNSIELSFSLDDRVAHRDRKSYFRTHATEVADVLKNLPWMLEKLDEIFIFFLVKCKIDLTKVSGNMLKSRFRTDSLVSNEFTVSKSELDIFSRIFLETLSFKEIALDSPEALFSQTEMEPEICFSALRANLSENYIEYVDDEILLGKIRITQKGLELLDRYLST